VHLEFDASYRVAPASGAEYLILAGDIGDPRHEDYAKFLEDAASKFKHVFLITGNHEAYGSSVARTHAAVDRVVAQPSMQGRVTHLQRKAFDVPCVDGSVVRVLGATLWSDVCAGDPGYAVSFLSDFSLIEGMTIQVRARALGPRGGQGQPCRALSCMPSNWSGALLMGQWSL
jgi:hypothetical protein